jgi:oxaloacetate decarboxylase alpha subunit
MRDGDRPMTEAERVRARRPEDGSVGIIDTTLRDAQQCLWTTRMTAGMMLPVAERMDRAGFEMIDFMAPVQFDVCVRYLRENPFEKARLLKERFPRTPLRGYCRSKSLTGFSLAPEDMVEMWMERLAANGFSVVGTLDALFDVDNMAISIRHGKRLGLYTVAALVFSESPVHTDEVYAGTARALIEETDVDAIMIKDSGGLLTPERIRTLVPALKAVMGDRPLELHSHCNTGLAPLVYLEGARLGVEQLHASIAPLASGPAQPSVQNTLSNLFHAGFEAHVDRALVDEVSAYLHDLAEQEGFPLGQPMEYDVFHYKHQMPGGMLNNWRFQLRQNGLEDRFDEILEEIVRIRAELGWPIMVTPFSQLVGVQAMLNVVSGERYGSVPDEIKRYALGHYGRLLAPVEPDVLDRIVANGSPAIPIEPEPIEPGRPALERAYPDLDDDERMLRYMFAAQDVDATMAAGPIRITTPLGSPVERLVRGLVERGRVRAFELEHGRTRVALRRIGGAPRAAP